MEIEIRRWKIGSDRYFTTKPSNPSIYTPISTFSPSTFSPTHSEIKYRKRRKKTSKNGAPRSTLGRRAGGPAAGARPQTPKEGFRQALERQRSVSLSLNFTHRYVLVCVCVVDVMI